jgi:DUF4097 and DUF4098 domain-containing protein YvlB
MKTRNFLPAAGVFTTLSVLMLVAPAAAQSRHWEKRFAIDGKPVIILRNPSGRIHVKAADRKEVLASAQLSGSRVMVESEQSGNRVEMTTELAGPQTSSPADLRADFEVTVPTESELQIRTDSGSVIIESVHGDMSFDTVAADLALQDVDGMLVIKSVGGSLVCTRCAGRLDATTISGNFTMTQPMLNRVRLQTSSGNIFFDGDFVSRGIYVMKSYSGTIDVRFSDQNSFDVHATSLYGKVVNQAPVVPDARRVSAPPASVPGMARSLVGSVNQGLGMARVELSSFNGTIRISKRE